MSEEENGSTTKSLCRCLFSLLLALLVLQAASFHVSASDFTFSIVWITDTQYLSRTYPLIFDNATNWIVNNKDAYNIKMVVHTGDVVNTYSDSTQWDYANHSMGILLDKDIPYCWDAGNHDKNGNYWIGQNCSAFNVTLVRGKTYWESDTSDGKNTAVHFDFSNWSFLTVNIEFEASDSVLDWASGILDMHLKSYCIVATHAYLNETAQYYNSAWTTRFQERVLTNHSNVFMTLNGHRWLYGNANRTSVGNRNELLFDCQNLDSERGGATLRILSFNMLQGKIDIRTYKPYNASFVTDSDNEFTLNIPLDLIPEFQPNIMPLIMILITSCCVLNERKHAKSHKL
jgi:hypothetical protein